MSVASSAPAKGKEPEKAHQVIFSEGVAQGVLYSVKSKLGEFKKSPSDPAINDLRKCLEEAVENLESAEVVEAEQKSGWGLFS